MPDGFEHRSGRDRQRAHRQHRRHRVLRARGAQLARSCGAHARGRRRLRAVAAGASVRAPPTGSPQGRDGRHRAVRLGAPTGPSSGRGRARGRGRPGLGLVLLGAGMDMSAAMASAAMPMPMAWSPGHAAVMALMWALMMLAMMLPSAAPMILLHATVSRRRDPERGGRRAFLFALAYAAVWSGSRWRPRPCSGGWSARPAHARHDRRQWPFWRAAAPGHRVYQFTPLKRACLRQLPLATGVPRRALAQRGAAGLRAWAPDTAPIASVAAGR